MALKKASKRFSRAFSDFRAQDIELRGAFQWYSPTTPFFGSVSSRLDQSKKSSCQGLITRPIQ
jgi:hypothetical protein